MRRPAGSTRSNVGSSHSHFNDLSRVGATHSWHPLCTTTDRRAIANDRIQCRADKKGDAAMNSQTMTANAFGGGQSASNFRGWVTFAGITLMVLGTAAVIYDVTATIVSVVLFGWLLLVAGSMQIVHAFQVRNWGGFFLFLLDGIVRAAFGTLLVLYPGS